jgi:decaprenylphospho-beta-D-erythro-pentofuranosid-2-ulose 2-reductase
MLTTRPRKRPWQAPDAVVRPADSPLRVLLLGGTSEIGLAILSALRLTAEAEVVLAGRDNDQLARAAAALPCRARTLRYEATDLGSHASLIAQVFDQGPVDLAISAAGVLTSQTRLEAEPVLAGQLIDINFAGHVTALLAVADRMRAGRSGTIVVLSSVAAIRPRKANFVYGAAKAGLDAFARGLADSLHGTGVRVLIVRPGFVIGRMTRGLEPAPLATTPAKVGTAVAAALAGSSAVVWVPPTLRPLAVALQLVPRPLWRRLRR